MALASPITVGITAIIVAPLTRRRSSIRFQNTGSSIIYIKKRPLEGAFTPVSATDYEVLMQPSSTLTEAGDAFETDSISPFMAISSAAGGILSIYETIKS